MCFIIFTSIILQIGKKKYDMTDRIVFDSRNYIADFTYICVTEYESKIEEFYKKISEILEGDPVR